MIQKTNALIKGIKQIFDKRMVNIRSFWYFVHFVVPMEISPIGNSGSVSQGKPAAAESRYSTLIKYELHAGSFRVSIIHRALTWTTGALACVLDHSYAPVYTRGLGTLTTSQHNIFDSE